jgi:hypothetical protein
VTLTIKSGQFSGAVAGHSAVQRRRIGELSSHASKQFGRHDNASDRYTVWPRKLTAGRGKFRYGK